MIIFLVLMYSISFLNAGLSIEEYRDFSDETITKIIGTDGVKRFQLVKNNGTIKYSIYVPNHGFKTAIKRPDNTFEVYYSTCAFEEQNNRTNRVKAQIFFNLLEKNFQHQLAIITERFSI